ncbi:MAG: hypothetical protein ACTSYS_03155 [Promethearchaeota archaeon]
MIQLSPVVKSSLFSTVHLICIFIMIILIVKTSQRYNQKKKNLMRYPKKKHASVIRTLLYFEIVVLVGFILQNISSDVLLYMRIQQEADAAYQNPDLLAFVEYTNFSFQIILVFVAYFLALFSNRVFLFRGEKFEKLNLIILTTLVSLYLTVMIIALINPSINLAWSKYSPIIGKREPQVWIMAINSLYIIIILLLTLKKSFWALKSARMPVEKGGIKFINLFFSFIILLIFFQGIFILTKIYFFSYSSWFLIPVGILWAYCGLMMPKKVKKWLERRNTAETS